MPHGIWRTRSLRRASFAFAVCSLFVIAACSSGAGNQSDADKATDNNDQSTDRPAVSQYDPRPSIVKRGCTDSSRAPQQFCPELSQ